MVSPKQHISGARVPHSRSPCLTCDSGLAFIVSLLLSGLMCEIKTRRKLSTRQQWVFIGTSLSARVPQRTGIERDADHIQDRGQPGAQHTLPCWWGWSQSWAFPEFTSSALLFLLVCSRYPPSWHFGYRQCVPRSMMPTLVHAAWMIQCLG